MCSRPSTSRPGTWPPTSELPRTACRRVDPRAARACGARAASSDRVDATAGRPWEVPLVGGHVPGLDVEGREHIVSGLLEAKGHAAHAAEQLYRCRLRSGCHPTFAAASLIASSTPFSARTFLTSAWSAFESLRREDMYRP